MLMPRYVILEHDQPFRHWDLLLEAGQVLRSWRLAAPPQAGEPVEALALFDHRLMYLDYQGPIGGNRGQVTRWDAGTFSWEEQTHDSMLLLMNGVRLRGQAFLSRVSQEKWSFLWQEP